MMLGIRLSLNQQAPLTCRVCRRAQRVGGVVKGADASAPSRGGPSDSPTITPQFTSDHGICTRPLARGAM